MVYVEGRTPTQTTPRGRLGVKWNDAQEVSSDLNMKSGSGWQVQTSIKPQMGRAHSRTTSHPRIDPPDGPLCAAKLR